MMTDAFLLYLLTRVWAFDSAATELLTVSIVVFVSALVFWGISKSDDEEEHAQWAFKVMRIDAWVVLAALLAALILPSKQDTIFILASTGVLAAAKSDAAQSIASKSVAVIEQFLNEQLEKK